jgi:excisionase family DNA binding protein
MTANGCICCLTEQEERMAEPEPIYVRLDTAAKLLDTSPRMVEFWIKNGTLPAVKLGRQWRLRRADLENLPQKAVPAQ